MELVTYATVSASLRRRRGEVVWVAAVLQQIDRQSENLRSSPLIERDDALRNRTMRTAGGPR